MNSWSRLKITMDMFKLLCGICQLNPRYLSLVEGMGLKSGLDDEHFMSCYRHMSMREAGTRAKEISTFGKFLPLILDWDEFLTNCSNHRYLL